MYLILYRQEKPPKSTKGIGKNSNMYWNPIKTLHFGHHFENSNWPLKILFLYNLLKKIELLNIFLLFAVTNNVLLGNTIQINI